MHQTGSSFEQPLAFNLYPTWPSSYPVDCGKQSLSSPSLGAYCSSTQLDQREKIELPVAQALDSAGVHGRLQVSPSQDGVHTPPPEMASSQLDSLAHNNYTPHKSIHYTKTPRSHFHGSSSNISDIYTAPSKSAVTTWKPPQSPTPSPVWTNRPEADDMGNEARSDSSNSTLIAASMQIPSSINNSQGSLAEFAAQITCLFWFESSQTLQRVEESEQTTLSVSPLTKEAVPSLGFLKWVTTILSTTQVSQNVVILALMFIHRLKKLNPSVKGKAGSEYRLLTVALMLGNKFLDDNTYTNKTWAEVSGISVSEIHIMEVEFLSNMRYSLFTTMAEWNQWHKALGRFWTYFDRASRRLVEAKTIPTAVSPMLNVPFSLPSPPASTNASPPFVSSFPPSHIGHPHPLSMPPQLAPAMPSPAESVFDIGGSQRSRKRSYDDAAQEPPAKRLSRPVAPLPTGHPHMNHQAFPSQRTDGVPHLPMPNVTMNPTPPASIGGHTPTHLPLPAGGRAMSMVYPSSSSAAWPQAGLVSTAPVPTSSSAMNRTTFTDGSRTSSPYHPTMSYSPIANAVTPGQNHMSPSFFLSQRSSPYRPVRHVSQLLIPPPSASLHDRNEPLELNQMHYHPLGRPRNECRTGVLPYMQQDSWPQVPRQLPQWPLLPQPNFSV